MARARTLPVLIAAAVLQLATNETAALTLDRVLVTHVTPGEPPTRSATWKPVSLPHRWFGLAGSESVERWYRFDVELPGFEGELQGVLLRDVAMNAEVLWNGVGIGDGGRFDPPMAQNFHRPLYLRVPSVLVKEGSNELLVRVATPAHFHGWLGAVEVGPDTTLSRLYQDDLAWRSTVPAAATILGVLLTLLAAAFWYASRDSQYGWFVLFIFCFTLGGMNLHVRDLIVPTEIWARVTQLCLTSSSLFLAIHAHRLSGVTHPRFERVLGACAALLILLALLVPSRAILSVFTALHPLAILFGLYAFCVIVFHLWGSSRRDLFLFVPVGIFLLAIATHDMVIQLGERERTPRYWSSLASPALLLGFGSLVTFRFMRAFRRVGRMNDELEERVRAKHEELEIQFERLQGLEEIRVRSAEREHIMREMHDGLGGRLVETLSMVESGGASDAEVATALRGSLDEMRLLIDSLDPLVEDLPHLLASIRERLEPSLRRSGIALEWRVGSLSPISRFGSDEMLHVLRIVQEALTNVLKHASARHVCVATEANSGAITIEIRDDGTGIPQERPFGRGLRNMEARAHALGGSIELRPGQPGTVVALRLPS